MSASDKLHNVRTILADYRNNGDNIWVRFNGKKEGTLWYYRALSNEYARTPNRITRELEITVGELERVVGWSADATNGPAPTKPGRGTRRAVRR